MVIGQVINGKLKTKRGEQVTGHSGSGSSSSSVRPSGGRIRGMVVRCFDAVGNFVARVLPQRKQRGQRIRLSSYCTGSFCHEAEQTFAGFWRDYCPVCKRPVEVRLLVDEDGVRDGRSTHHGIGCASLSPASARYAYVAVLWGSSPAYILGAMVLAKSLRTAGTQHDLVLLWANVPQAGLELLSQAGWITKEVHMVYGVRALYAHGEPRFVGVFTKLHALALYEYEKVLLLDIDTLVYHNMDDLFGLPAPAALCRGPYHSYAHGSRIEGKYFFAGAKQIGPTWGQCGGINAGVMLMQPNKVVFDHMMREVLDDKHPSHIRGNGPEQDYLSRYWANCWTHIGVEYNFQLHQMYFMLNPRNTNYGERAPFLKDPAGSESNLRLVHYSGFLKPWQRVLDAEYAVDPSLAGDAKFLDETLKSFNGYWMWVAKDREMFEHQGMREGMGMDAEGKIRYIDWDRYYDKQKPWWAQGKKRAADPDADRDAEEEGEMAPDGGGQTMMSWGEELPLGEEVLVSESAVKAAETIVRVAIERWMGTYHALARELGVKDLAEATKAACGVSSTTVSSDMHNGPSETNADTASGAGSPTTAADVPETGGEGWKNHSGWWIDRPVTDRASALVGRIPEPFVQLCLRCKPLVNLRGDEAKGIHAAAFVEGQFADSVGENHPLFLQGASDLANWAAQVPPEAVVMIACVDLEPAAWSNVLTTLSSCGFSGLPNAAPPADCGAAAWVGRKTSKASECQTMAAADFALASFRIAGRGVSSAQGTSGV